VVHYGFEMEFDLVEKWILMISLHPSALLSRHRAPNPDTSGYLAVTRGPSTTVHATRVLHPALRTGDSGDASVGCFFSYFR
jgi:hypothetical protein